MNYIAKCRVAVKQYDRKYKQARCGITMMKKFNSKLISQYLCDIIIIIMFALIIIKSI